jgi:quercetin dioxygenase-like cupin family protein
MDQYFINVEDIRSKEISTGIRIQVASGERLMLSFVEISEGANMPIHSHSHEQAGIVLDGEIEFTISMETRILKSGQSYLIPANVPHGVKPVCRARVLDIFSPPREDYL